MSEAIINAILFLFCGESSFRIGASLVADDSRAAG
jgi:hypothetical protein